MVPVVLMEVIDGEDIEVPVVVVMDSDVMDSEDTAVDIESVGIDPVYSHLSILLHLATCLHGAECKVPLE